MQPEAAIWRICPKPDLGSVWTEVDARWQAVIQANMKMIDRLHRSPRRVWYSSSAIRLSEPSGRCSAAAGYRLS